MNYFKNYIEISIFYTFLVYFKILPYKLVTHQLKIIFYILGYCFGVRKKVITQQLKLIFPEKKMNEIKTITKKIYSEMAVTVAEVFIFNEKYFKNKIEILGIENVENALQLGKGLLINSAHFSNWEMGVQTLAKIYKNVSGVVKKQRNPLFNYYIEMKRKEAGIKTIEMKNAIKHVVKALQKNEIVVFALDQYAFKQGVVIDFLGHQTKSYTSAAQIAIKYKTPIISAFDLRDESGKHTVIFHEPVFYHDTAYTEDNIIKVTKQLNKNIENYIHQYPHLWFWVHKKWRKALQG